MRLSQWKAVAPTREAMSAKVLGVLQPVVTSLGVGPDPECWVVWGDEPSSRYVVLAPGSAGLVVCHVRVSVPGEGPRAAAKVIRWPRVQLGELATETQQGHRLTSFQVDGQVLRGVDAEADRVAAFAIELFAAADGRPAPATTARPARARGASAATPARGAGSARASTGNGAGVTRARTRSARGAS